MDTRVLWLALALGGCFVDARALVLGEDHTQVPDGDADDWEPSRDAGQDAPDTAVMRADADTLADASQDAPEAGQDADVLPESEVDGGAGGGAGSDAGAAGTGGSIGVDAGRDAGCVPGPVYRDEDGDGWGVESDVLLVCGSLPGYSPKFGDCYDHNPLAKPGTSGPVTWFTVDRGDGSYDYNCDGVETPQWTAVQRCPDDGGSGAPGWVGSPPVCGETGTWKTSSFCPGGPVMTVQPCR